MNKIKFYRTALGLSTYKIASKTGLAASYISNLEHNKRVNPSRETMEKISKALGKSIVEVFFPDEKEEC